MTTLAREIEEQKKWRVRRGEKAPWADELLRNEFLPPAEQERRVRRALSETLEFAATLPYYARLFRRNRIRDLDAPDALVRIPTLPRPVLQENAAALRNARLPVQERDQPTRSSGTTGEPTEVAQSVHSMAMFAMLKQREYRWFRFDPALKMCTIRPAPEFRQMPDGSWLPEKSILRTPGWPYVGPTFETGPWMGFANTNTIEDQVVFMHGEAPHYLVMQSAGLEHLALAMQGRPPRELQQCLAISQTLTETMRATVEAHLAPVQQVYGLNEIGIVASRCPEGRRYHVHIEHCVVEIIDPDGRPVRPGERGRLVITCLTNRAMPLLRYDADDFATAVDGPCPCGRTLPSFGEILGRYRRIALLPPGSWQRWAAIQLALYQLPPEQKRYLRRYQAHEYADRRWVLRVHAPGASIEAIAEFVRARLAQVTLGEAAVLEVVATDQFEGKPGGKFQDFLSDHFPAPEEAR